MTIAKQIIHEAQTIINIANLCNPNNIDRTQLKVCIRRLSELEKLFEMDYDTLAKIMTTCEC